VSGSPVSRRLLLRGAGGGGLVAAGALAAAVLGGCDLDPRSTAPAAAPADPDRAIVDAARAELSGLIVRLSATPGAASLATCHRRQLEALQGRLPARPGRRLTPRQVAARERRAAARFRSWALTCRNGDLARLLASVAAGIEMQSLPNATGGAS
jgi:hypothetical protein